MKKLIFTDLDGTLLDLASYSPEKARDAVKKLKSAGVSIIFCSSKTWAEQESYLQELSLDEPVIVENGSGIFLPRDHQLQFELESKLLNGKPAIVLGKRYEEILNAIKSTVSSRNLHFDFYFNKTVAQIAEITGLTQEAAKRAMDRNFSETLFNASSDPDGFALLESDLLQQEIQCTPGSKYVTMTGNNSDKGKAVQLVIEAYKKLDPETISYGIGDSRNDLEMLQVVDHPYLVQKPDRSWAQLDAPHLSKINAVGPEGWNLMAQEVLAP